MFAKIKKKTIFRESETLKKVSEYDQEIPQSHTADQPSTCNLDVKQWSR